MVGIVVGGSVVVVAENSFAKKNQWSYDPVQHHSDRNGRLR